MACNESLQALGFPYPSFRKGQRDFSVAVYKAVIHEDILFARAPTGTGKTIATLFPALKAMGMGFVDKIFYLTAKTVGRTVAEAAIVDIIKAGAKLKSTTITAKEKICFIPEATCTAKSCKYIKDYANRLNESLPYMIENGDVFDRVRIEELARDFGLCPFELSLDLSLHCDCIICDYNYAFDIRVYLKRYFDKVTGSYLFLIDEAHNLPDRLRNMYSVELDKRAILQVRRGIKEILPESAEALNQINTLLLQERKNLEEKKVDHVISKTVPPDLIKAVKAFVSESEEYVIKPGSLALSKDFIDAFYLYSHFKKLAELFSDGHVFCYQRDGQSNLRARIMCIDPAPLFTKSIKRCKSAIFFSATLFPFDYFSHVLIGEQEHEVKKMMLRSPFNSENLKLMVYRGISTRYRDRDASYERIVQIITMVWEAKRGNYIIFFPSYAYMEAVVNIIYDQNRITEFIVQERNMDEARREEFINMFSEDGALLCFAVMGGIFGEGIDLAGTRLIGTIIVGVGLPGICFEQDLIRDYFNKKEMHGFDYAYTFPGFNRVLQAVGRVIRSETDRGIAILIDDRFLSHRYLSLFPPEWASYQVLDSIGQLSNELHRFQNDSSI